MKFTQLLFAVACSTAVLAQPKPDPVCDPSFTYCTNCECAQGVKADMDQYCRDQGKAYSLGGSLTIINGVCCKDG
ncbi:hypothetical protein BUE80_DR009318 [Diplocarpon rosae]|nr:hypothetical protein BUE80_DR009318 [Diplocarpon rosae]